MPDRRRFLRAAMGVPVSALATGVPDWLTTQPLGTMTMRAVVRQPSGDFVTVDPRSGEIGEIALPARARRVHAHPASRSLLIELASGSLRIRRVGDSGEDIELDPIAPDSPPLVIANRVIGRDVSTHRLRICNLMTGECDQVASDVLPGTPDRWQMHVHPTLPAVVIDARAVDGGVVLLPAGEAREPQAVPIPPDSAVGIAPSSKHVVLITHAGDASTLVCHPSDVSMRERRMPYLTLDGGVASIRGPVGASDNLLLTADHDWLSIVSCAGSQPQVVDATSVSGGDDASVHFWCASPDGEALLGELVSGGVTNWFWWSIGEEPQMLPELPENLETALAAGCAERWFHGAALTETSLGAGDLRLMAVDMATGEIVFDHTVDRRLELAATAVSGDGSLLAHCQSGNADVELLVASFGDTVTSKQFRIDIEDAPVAAAEIMLDVATADETGVVAAGLHWGNPHHHAPMVVISATGHGFIADPLRVDGELVGIIPFR